MKKRIVGVIFLVLVVASALWIAEQSSAGTLTYWGCLECVEKNTFGVIPNDFCRDVADGWGSTHCTEWSAWPQQTCTLHGEACEGILVIGGGGGGGGGNGWNTTAPCIISGGGWCPPECFECVRTY